MKFLQGVALGLLAALLFASLILVPEAVALHNTWLGAEFASQEVAKLDSVQVARELLPSSLPGDLAPYSSAIDTSILELRPWIEAQSRLAVSVAYDYLSGAVPSFSLTIPTGIVQQTLVRNFEAAFLKSPPAGYSRLTAAQQQQLLAQDKQTVQGFIPANITLSEKTLGRDITQSLSQLKTAYGFAQKTYVALITISAILVLLLVLVARQGRGITRTLGIVFVLAGGISFVLCALAGNWLLAGLDLSSLPGQFQTWVPQVIDDTLTPGKIAGLAILGLGAISLVGSFLFRPNH